MSKTATPPTDTADLTPGRHEIALDIRPPLPEGKAFVAIARDGVMLHRVIDRAMALKLELLVEQGAADAEFCEAVEHLNRVVAMMVPLEFNATEDAAVFLLRAHRMHGTQIRQSVFDCAVKLEKEIDNGQG